MTQWRRVEAEPASESKPKDRVLYVEDEAINWEITEMALRDHYQLTRACNAKEAFASLRNGHFRLILMDIQLSGSELNGIEITQLLKDRFRGDVPDYAKGVRCPDTPIVFVTAYSARYQREALIQMGGADLLTKPVNFTNMSLVLSRLLSRSTVQRIERR